jgi:hypothetical protein
VAATEAKGRPQHQTVLRLIDVAHFMVCLEGEEQQDLSVVSVGVETSTRQWSVKQTSGLRPVYQAWWRCALSGCAIRSKCNIYLDNPIARAMVIC